MQSEKIGELAKAMAKAQLYNNPEQESLLAYSLFRLMNQGMFLGRGRYKKQSKLNSFFEKIAYGRSECWYWMATRNKSGYGVLNSSLAHRIAWQLFNGDIPENLLVLHKCDVPACVNPNHLFLGTQLTNMRDCIKKGRQKLYLKKRKSNENIQNTKRYRSPSFGSQG